MKSPTDNRSTAKTRKNCGLDVIHHLKKGQYPSSFLGRLFNKRLALSFLAAMAMSLNISAQAIVSDPTVAAAVTLDMETTKNIGEDQKKEMTKMQAAMLVVDAQLAALHKLEDQWLDYLKTCANTVENVEQLWDIAEELIELPTNLENLVKAMQDKPSGALKQAAITLFEAYHKEQTSLLVKVPKTIANCKKIISQIVLNGKSAIHKDSLNFQFNVEQDSAMSYHKASLLNSYERIALLNELKHELSDLNWKIRLNTYGVKYATWWGVFRAFDPESYYFYIDAERICKQVINTF